MIDLLEAKRQTDGMVDSDGTGTDGTVVDSVLNGTGIDGDGELARCGVYEDDEDAIND